MEKWTYFSSGNTYRTLIKNKMKYNQATSLRKFGFGLAFPQVDSALAKRYDRFKSCINHEFISYELLFHFLTLHITFKQHSKNTSLSFSSSYKLIKKSLKCKNHLLFKFLLFPPHPTKQQQPATIGELGSIFLSHIPTAVPQHSRLNYLGPATYSCCFCCGFSVF